MALRARQKSDASGPAWHLERPRSLRDQVYDRLRSAILSGEMAAGTAVIEADIATRLGASRTPVREALRRLETEGMLEPRGGRGTVVRELKRDEVTCIFEIREALESLAARRASRRMQERDYREIERLIERMRKHVDDAAEMERLDTAFHDGILAHADGIRLKRMLGDLRSDILPWRFLSLATLERRQATIDEHAAIAEATSRHIINTRDAVGGESSDV
jgi:DNA-binding GntR family transcriptional regulator